MNNKSFTKQVENVMTFSHESAIKFSHDYVNTEHLLLGLLMEKKGLASRVLRSYNITEEKIEKKIEEIVGRGVNGSNVAKNGFSNRTKKVLELSFIETRKVKQTTIGTSHLLLGILKEGNNVAVDILNKLDVDLRKITADVIRGMNMTNEAALEKNTQKEKNKSSTPTLDSFSKDLTKLASEGEIDPVIGRDLETKRIVRILSRRTKNNPFLIGEPGVGKTSVVEGLAQKIVNDQVPDRLKGKRVILLDLSSLVAGAKYRGDFEGRFKKIIEEVKKSENVLLFIDEAHTIIGAGSSEGAIDASGMLKPLLAKGEIQFIGATTTKEYKKYIERDSALERRLQPVVTKEPSIEDAILILKGIKDKYETYHGVVITDDAIEASVKLSHRYIVDRFLPDKAIDLLDETAAMAKLNVHTYSSVIKNLKEKKKKISKEKQRCVENKNYEEATRVENIEKKIVKRILKEEKKEKELEQKNGKYRVTECDVANIVSEWTGVPVEKLKQKECQKLLNLEDELHKRIVGQNEAVSSISKAIRRGRVGLKDPNRPIGSFIFLGPTGVGKTELVKALAETVMGDEKAIIRIDMSEYMEKHSVSKLIGSPPGYVGFEDGGQLTEKIRSQQHSVVLFDEIEKAHPDVFNMLLQILEEGRLTDSKGRLVDFKNTIIVLTSNVGARQIIEPKKVGFNSIKKDSDSVTYKDMKNNVMGELKNTFKPEFINRIDDIIVFHPLNQEHIKQIAQNILDMLLSKISDRGITIEVTQKAKEFLAEKGYDASYGARPLKRYIQNTVEDKLVEEILLNNISINDTALIDLKVMGEDEEIVITKKDLTPVVQ